MTQKYIILDTDTGCDDSYALLLAAGYDQFKILALTCTFGNNAVETTTKNTIKIAKLFGIDAPVAKGAWRPLLDPPMDYSGGLGIAIHGQDGLGNIGDRLPDGGEPSELIAVDLMAKVIREADQKVTIVATGPLTNVATFLVSYPELKGNIEQIALMGGAAYGGNMTFNVEANIGHDADAAKIVFSSGVPIVMFGLDATMGAYITRVEREAMKETGGEVGAFLCDVLQPYDDVYHALANMPGASLHDSLPVAWLIDETCVELQDAYVDIDLDGVTSRGCTVCDFTGRMKMPFNARVAMASDREKIIKLHMDALKTVNAKK